MNANQIEPGLTRFFDMQSVLARILILGSLVWSHESYPRYPAPPNAPDSLDEAAKRPGGGVTWEQNITQKSLELSSTSRL